MPEQSLDNSLLLAIFNQLLVLVYLRVKERGTSRETLLADLASELDLYRSETFHSNWDELVSQFINNPPPVDKFLSKVDQVLSSVGSLLSSVAKSRGPSNLVSYGPFKALVRTLGLKPGIESGRAPGLVWPSSEASIRSVKLKEAIDAIEDGDVPEIESVSLPFCRGCDLWHLWFRAKPPTHATDADAFVITAKSREEPIFLDWTNEPIYLLNELKLFRFSGNLRAYVRCFFHLVRGRLGRFTILDEDSDVENLIPWSPGAEPSRIEADKKRIASEIRPFERLNVNASGETVFRATVLFKNAIFVSEVVVSPKGELRLEKEELKLEGLSIEVDEEGPEAEDDEEDEGAEDELDKE